MNVDGAYSHVGVEGIFVEQYSATSTVGDVVMVREGIVLRVLDCLWKRKNERFSCSSECGSTENFRRLGETRVPFFMCQARTEVGSEIIHTVLESRMNEVSSSKSERISVSEQGNRNLCGVVPLDRMCRV